jgi:pimeloyl-ACP methyl ester carboxylesterase
MPCREALVYTQSEDGLLLAGIRITPAHTLSTPITILWIHGNTGTFYDWPYVAVGRALVEHGYSFLSCNTRGHDITATVYRLPDDIPIAGGSAWEQLEDAPADLGAWVAFAIETGSQHIVLVGHSHGATKSILYQGQRADPRVGAIILASPEQHGHWIDSLPTAQELVATGRPNALLTLFPEEPWYQLAAHNIVSRAQALEQAYTRKQGTPYLGTITSPILAIYGTGGDVGGEADLALLRQTARQSRRMDTKLIEGADHVYTGYEAQLASLIADWITGVV